jgi:hypothetical protein
MHGTISISSKIGEGTTFNVSVPVDISQGKDCGNSQSQIDIVRPNSSSLSVSQVRILVAMDYKYNLDEATKFFNSLNCEVETAETPSAALQKF